MWDEFSEELVSLLQEGVSVVLSGVVESVYKGGEPTSPNSYIMGMQEVSEAWSGLWTLLSEPPPLLEWRGKDEEELEEIRTKIKMVVRIQAMVRGYLSRKKVRDMWELAAKELARRLKKRLGRGEDISIPFANGGPLESAILWVTDKFDKTVVEVTGVTTEFKSIDVANLSYARNRGTNLILKFLGRKDLLNFQVGDDAEAAIVAASLEIVSVWYGSSKPKFDQKRTSHFLELLKASPKWLLKRKGKSYKLDNAVSA
jgi:hypothetical protein